MSLAKMTMRCYFNRICQEISVESIRDSRCLLTDNMQTK